MDPQIFQSAEVISNDPVGAQVRQLVIKPNQAFLYEPGQFFILRLKDDKGELVERSYSVANWGSSGELEFMVRIEPHGHMSGLIDRLQVGQSIEIKGPFGRFGSIAPTAKELVMIAGGVGLSPIRCMIQRWHQEGQKLPAQLFYGCRTGKDYLFREELEGYAAEGNLNIIASISRDDAGWTGLTGYIPLHFEGNIFEPSPEVDCFICGPPDMVRASREKLLELGFERKQIHVEAW